MFIVEEYIGKIICNYNELFTSDYKIEKVNAGFTNLVYTVDNFVIKVCTKLENEDNFQKEINFYMENKNNKFIPKLYAYDTSKKIVPFMYEIMEKIEGDSLYNVWHKFTNSEREDIIRKLCLLMKRIHSIKGNPYDWAGYMKERVNDYYSVVKKLGVFSSEEMKKIEFAISKFHKYLNSDDFVLVHNDVHFDNVIYCNGEIKLIDFEKSMYAPRDYELNIFFRMIDKPLKYASEENEKYVKLEDYSRIKGYVEKYYPEILDVPYLDKRLAIYKMVYEMKALVKYHRLDELKDCVLNAVAVILS